MSAQKLGSQRCADTRHLQTKEGCRRGTSASVDSAGKTGLTIAPDVPLPVISLRLRPRMSGHSNSRYSPNRNYRVVDPSSTAIASPHLYEDEPISNTNYLRHYTTTTLDSGGTDPVNDNSSPPRQFQTASPPAHSRPPSSSPPSMLPVLSQRQDKWACSSVPVMAVSDHSNADPTDDGDLAAKSSFDTSSTQLSKPVTAAASVNGSLEFHHIGMASPPLPIVKRSPPRQPLPQQHQDTTYPHLIQPLHASSKVSASSHSPPSQQFSLLNSRYLAHHQALDDHQYHLVPLPSKQLVVTATDGGGGGGDVAVSRRGSLPLASLAPSTEPSKSKATANSIITLQAKHSHYPAPETRISDSKISARTATATVATATSAAPPPPLPTTTAVATAAIHSNTINGTAYNNRDSRSFHEPLSPLEVVTDSDEFDANTSSTVTSARISAHDFALYHSHRNIHQHHNQARLPQTPSHSSHPSASGAEDAVADSHPDLEHREQQQQHRAVKDSELEDTLHATGTNNGDKAAREDDEVEVDKSMERRGAEDTHHAPPIASDSGARANSMDMAFERRLNGQGSTARAYLAYRVESQVLAPILDYDEGRSGGDDDYDNGGGPSGERRRRGYRVPPPYVNAWRDHPLGRRAETHDPLKAQPPPPSRKNRETTTPMETGYEGDREDNGNLQGADQNSRLRPNARPQPPQQSPRLPPLRRRNTVAGDMIMSAPSVKRRVHHGVQTTLADDAKIDWDQVRKMGRKGGQRAQLSHGRRKSGGPGQHQHQHQQPVYGTRISEGHANYMLMYNMLTGIRISVSRCSAKPARQVVQEDYLAAHKYSFDIVGDELTPITRYDFKFKDYAPWVFRHIREAFHLDSSDYLMSLTDKYILSEVGSSGKSGSFFYYSQDFRFIIKTVRHTEHKFMRKILPQYYEYVRDNPNTMLSRIYGLHRIKLPEGRKVHFIVMSNIFPPNKDIHAQYDLKGSLHGRILMPEEAAKPRACLKDQNWLNNGIKLQLGPAKRREFVEQLIRDVELLIKLRIMDYSLLVGIHDIQRGNHGKIRNATLSVFDPEKTQIPDKPYPQMTRANTIRDKVARTDPMVLDRLAKGDYPALPESMFRELTYSKFYCDNGGYLATDKNDQPTNMIYYLGVIDILTPYNAIKRMEHVARSVRYYDRHTISAVNPRYYGLRFLKFIIEGIGNSDDVRPLLEGFENRQRRMHYHRFHWGGGGGG